MGLCVERHRFSHIIFTQTFIYGDIKSSLLVHMHTTFSIIISYTGNISFHYNYPIKKFSQCKIDFSFSYRGQYKNNYILYMLAFYILQCLLLRIWSISNVGYRGASMCEHSLCRIDQSHRHWKIKGVRTKPRLSQFDYGVP